ncbi:LysM peptidoglycan-binding domain-containing protein [Sulfurimonas sp.]|nr:LysM peptidoglycan-binding domain-containing protein [Sulfurimonas sp.]
MLSIAKAHHISLKNLRAQNNIKGSFIKVGDRLKLYE